ncbi:chemotaxis protein cheA [Asticcacaulis biprosthecium C19]|uniref:Chemotaxis protein CheA n=1 Tax=Asticcacaulis biprosthecium C19 TaxID=715226 RepID=F4QTB1_9CAUL|nr:chemotaxis protein CheA [Asticcacaulis biprosthecium]EGF89981.1 chemotaxis protein cheA [Asticcacaulis biprosthecium C19]
MSTEARNDYAQFRQTFFAESAEMLADMDERLEALKTGRLDREELDAVFRAVHSIKAGAGMFDYRSLVDFAHGFEALLDRLRDGRMSVNATVGGLIIRAADILAELVAAAQAERAAPSGMGADVMVAINGLLGEGATPVTPAIAPVEIRDDTHRVEIRFTPHADLMRKANEPLLLIRELSGLGHLKTVCDSSRVPELESINSDDCYLSWTFELETTAGDDAIREVFEFVEDDAEIAIVRALAEAQDEGFGLWLDTEVADVAPGPVALTSDEPGGKRPPAQTSIRVDLSRVDRLVNMVGELVISQAMLRQELATHNLPVVDGLESLDVLTRELQDCVMAIRMQPVRSVFARMPRLVRDVAARLDKQVRLVMVGEQTELDKTVLEELSDPLTHMIRNSVDHGIEAPAIRIAAGKPAEGALTLSASHVGSNILIQIEDDGAGIDRARLVAKAVEKGIVAPGAVLSDDEILDLIFAPGFSTAETVSDVSGRGVGMDVVRRNIQKIGGRIQVSSIAGKGTRFTLIIPLTLAVLDGMLISVGTERYILPLTSIIESFRPAAAQVRQLSGGGRIVNVRGEFVPLLGLGRVFGVSDAICDPVHGLVVLTETATGGRLGLVVDGLIGQQQVVIKSLQTNFTAVPGISGGTILGDGRVALILDIEQLASLEETAA